MKKISVCLVDDDDWFRDMFSQYIVHTCRNISMTSEDFRSWRDGETAESHADGGGFDLYLFGGAGSEFASDEKTAEVSAQSVFLYRSEAERRYLQEALPSAGIVSKYISAQNIAAHINLALSERQIGTGLVSKEGSFCYFYNEFLRRSGENVGFSDACQIAAAEKKTKRAHCQHFSAV